jgi:hypothetical protein
VRGWLASGWDIILTGNPGDGKTHLLRYLDLPNTVHKETDASQRKSTEILDEWRTARTNAQRFVLAINHAPLRSLAQVAENDPYFHPLFEMVLTDDKRQSVIENSVVYSEEQKEFQRNRSIDRGNILVVDLSQREILTKENVVALLNKFAEIVRSSSCKDKLGEECSRCPLHENAAALTNSDIQNNISFMLSLVARRGFHATMRDLVGFLAFILTGGVTCDQLWQKNESGELPSHDEYNYYNLLFQGRGRLFDALRSTFDPGIYSDPRIDLKLWAGEIQSGWISYTPSTPVTVPTRLDDLHVAKRRYFFEHSENIEAKYCRMMTNLNKDFNNLIDLSDPENKIADLVEMINLFYTPLPIEKRGNYRDRLYLWNQHRYSVGQPPGYIAMRSVNVSALHLYRPEVNPLYGDALAIKQDHVILGIPDWLPGDPTLRIDWEMYRALWEAKQGMAIEVQPYSILRRLDLFLRRIGSKAGGWSATETILWGDYKKRSTISLKVNRTKATYEE